MAVHSFETMGTMVSIRLPDADLTELTAQTALGDIESECNRLNERFSLYLPESEISRIANGELALPDSSDEMRQEYARSLEWRNRTSGVFTPHRPDRVMDLSGTIKAVAIENAATILENMGFTDFSVNIGGDIRVSGCQSSQEPGWVTGVVDPENSSQLLSALVLTDAYPAMATSGTAERGEHIWSKPDSARDFIQATVIASDIITADVLATTIISGGQQALEQVTTDFSVAVMTVGLDGTLQANAKFQELVAR